jgi:hypothetical protein
MFINPTFSGFDLHPANAAHAFVVIEHLCPLQASERLAALWRWDVHGLNLR